MGERDVSDDDFSDMFDYTRAAPVPPFSEVSMEKLIRRTHFSLAVAQRDGHIVDDDGSDGVTRSSASGAGGDFVAVAAAGLWAVGANGVTTLRTACAGAASTSPSSPPATPGSMGRSFRSCRSVSTKIRRSTGRSLARSHRRTLPPRARVRPHQQPLRLEAAYVRPCLRCAADGYDDSRFLFTADPGGLLCCLATQLLLFHLQCRSRSWARLSRHDL